MIYSEVLEIIPQELVENARTIMLAGSLDLEADIDCYLVLKQDAPKNVLEWVVNNPETSFEGIAKHGIDLSSLTQSEFEKRTELLDVSVAHQLLDSKPIIGQEYFQEMVNKGKATKPAGKHVEFSFRESLRCYDTARTQFEIAKWESRNKTEQELKEYFENIVRNKPVISYPSKQLYNSIQMLGFSISYLMCSEHFQNTENRIISLKTLLEMRTPKAELLREFIKYKKSVKRGRKTSYVKIKNYLKKQEKFIKNYAMLL